VPNQEPLRLGLVVHGKKTGRRFQPVMVVVPMCLPLRYHFPLQVAAVVVLLR
jgi:hypothetical protein